MSLTYLLINVAIVSVPVWYTADKRTAYYRRLPAVVSSIFLVSSGYLVWDIAVTARGEWSFNSGYLTGARIINIPVEEFLFFVTVPYSCLFIYEVVLYLTRSGSIKIPALVVVAAILLSIGASILFAHQGYTSKALASCASFLALAWLVDRPLLRSKQYWLWLAICQIPFLIVNSILTALPVVQYNPTAIWGGRFITIPFEDFFYNFSMLSFYLLVYRRVRNGNPAGPAYPPPKVL